MTQLGGADDAALQESALRTRADKEFGVVPALSAAAEASLQGKSTASGAVRAVQFFDLETCLWQTAQQHFLRRTAYETSNLPSFGERSVYARAQAGTHA